MNLENIKALLYVLVLAVPAFYVGSKLAAAIVSRQEFAVWRNVWFALTGATFISVNNYIFAACLIIICLYVHATRRASVAIFFVMLFAAPLVVVEIGGLGSLTTFITLNSARILAIFLLLPLLFTTHTSRHQNRISYAMPDRVIVCYVFLMIILEFRRSEFTNVMRVGVLYTLDVLIPYFALSRRVTSVADFRKISLALVIAALPLALIGVFETARHWNLYNGAIATLGGAENMPAMRADLLRASASAIDSVNFGVLIMVAIGSALAIRPAIASRGIVQITLGVLAAGIVVSLSRGPWVATAVLVVAYLITGPNVVPNLFRLLLIGAGVMVLLLLTSAGQRLLDFLPFVGAGGANTVDYRQQLLENGMRVIQQNPWFGSESFLQTTEMQEMIQGQGIIDMVNSYLNVALYSGLVGLSLFIGFFAAILVGLRRMLKLKNLPIEIRIYTRASVATLFAILVVIGTTSSINFIPYIYWSFAALCVALIRITYSDQVGTERTARAGSSIELSRGLSSAKQPRG